MTLLREIFSFLFFIAALALLTSLVLEPFSVESLALCIAFFVLAYFLWPSKRRKQRDDKDSWVDWLELIIEFPVEIFLGLSRFLLRFLFKAGDGVDL